MRALGFEARRYGDSWVAADYAKASTASSQAGFADQLSADLDTLLKDYRNVLEGSDMSSPESPLAENDEPAGAAAAPLNQILFGPPGTGKTYSTINHALQILDPEFLASHGENAKETRSALKLRFDSLVNEGRVRFVTFHQSFSYEDFVEGLRADTDAESGQIEYRVESGIFKKLCDDARTRGSGMTVGIRHSPRIWKISINGSGNSPTKDYCLQHGEARIGWGETGDLRGSPEQNPYYQRLGPSDKGTLAYFAEEIAIGDILVAIQSADKIEAVGVVTGDYSYDSTVPGGVISDYQHVRPVRWLFRNVNQSILPLNDGRQFTLKTVYPLERFSWADLLSYLEAQRVEPADQALASTEEKLSYVLIIDEINRGNISRIFGELITLIEPSKREGADEALSVELPYSKKPFSVPSNVYLLGTMNTADRSLAGLDIALRRRFSFKEMPPLPGLLDDVVVEGVEVGQLLRMLNQRIEVLLDRDHCLGHAYFMQLREDNTLEALAGIFRNQILPLLQEYFFEDWERIQWVLNDHRKTAPNRIISRAPNGAQALFGPDVSVPEHDMPWQINEEAFERVETYLGIIDHQALPATEGGRQVYLAPYTVRLLTSGSIEVLEGDELITPVKPVLRELAAKLSVSTISSTGQDLNTRALGRRVILAAEQVAQ
ncbi:AAA domain-containing protein [Proteobacteria bacterium 005FR1]|nr:AAA domain-containing protein [Proteobacteria bacterium 005FR1]